MHIKILAKLKKISYRLVDNKKARPTVFLSIFSCIAVFSLIITMAAGMFSLSIEPEKASSTTGCAKNIDGDPSASNGGYVQFGCSTVTGWKQSALTGGGYVNGISMSPTDDWANLDSLRGVVVTDVSGIFFTNNGGKSWIPANNAALGGGDMRVASVLWHPTTPGLVFALYGDCKPGSGGIMRSTDYGRHWTKMSSTPIVCGNGMSANDGYGMPARRPRVIGKLMGIDSNSNFIYVGTFNKGIMRASLNDLSKWTTIALGEGTQGQGKFYIRGLTIDDKDPSVIYASTYDGTNPDDGDGRIWRIKNAGSANPVIEKFSQSPIDTEDVLSLDGNLYAVNAGPGIEGGIHRLGSARNANNTSGFKRIAGPAYTVSSCADASKYPNVCVIWFSIHGYVSNNKTTLWVGTSNTPLIGKTYKAFWKGTSTSGFASDDGSWSSYPDSKANMKNDVAGPQGDWWKYTTSTWAIPGYGYDYDIGDMSVGKDDSHAIFVAGEVGIWRSTNQGVDWEPAVDGFLNLVNREVVADPHIAGKVYQTNVDYALFESDDYLSTVKNWSKPSGMNSRGWALTIDGSTSPSTVYLGLGDRDTNTGGQIWRRDSNGSWSQIDTGPMGGKRVIGIGITKDSNGNQVMIAVTQANGLWRKVGNGAFSKISLPKTSKGKAFQEKQKSLRTDIQIAPGSSTFYIYDRQSGLWRGDNYGSSWTNIYDSPTDTESTGYMRVHPSDPKVVFVSDTSGVYRISNANTASSNGASAQKISGNLTNTGAMTLGPNNQLYFVTRPTSANRAKIYQGDFNQPSPSWTDISDDYFQSWAVKVITIAASKDGRLYASSGNNSTIVR